MERDGRRRSMNLNFRITNHFIFFEIRHVSDGWMQDKRCMEGMELFLFAKTCVRLYHFVVYHST